jgi:hypothetical protein
MRQTTLPRDQRVPVSVVADEFQTMTGTDFGALLGELQKNGGNFVLGTQALDNLRRIEETGTLAGSLFAGVATKFVFQVNGDDARYLVERELDIDRLRAESLVNLPRHHAYVKTISEDGRPLPVFLVKVAAPLTPDPTVASQVLAQRGLYTVAGDEADRLARRSATMLLDEHGGAQTAHTSTGRESGMGQAAEADQERATPPNSPGFIRRSAEVTGGEAADAETNRVTQHAVASSSRPKARPPTAGAWGPTAPPDEAGFERIAEGIGLRQSSRRGADGTSSTDRGSGTA